ncbi:MAG: TonB-dependent receptor [Pseudomonadota bacterium]
MTAVTQTHKTKLAGLALGTALGLSLMPHKAAAQVDDEIIVTAQRKAESINDVPLAIQAYDQELLTDLGVTDVSQLGNLTPGLSFAESNANTPILTIRGVGFNTPNLSATSPVGIYYDEVAYAYPYFASGPVFDLERAEVLKGPQGTLYGRNTTGGLINFIAAKPGNEVEAGAIAEFGNFQTYNFEGFVSAPLGNGFGARLAGRWENSDKGFQESASRPGDRLGEIDRLGLRSVLSYDNDGPFRADLIASYWQNKSDTLAPQAIAFNPDNPGFENPLTESFILENPNNRTADFDPDDGSKPPFRTDSDFFSLSARLSFDISDDLSVVSLTAYNSLDRNDQNDLDGTPIEVFTQQSIGEVESFSQEVRLVGSFDRGDFMVGGYYAKDDITDDQIGFINESSAIYFLRFVAQNFVDPTNALFTPEQYAGGFRSYRNLSDQESETVSIFGNINYDLTEKLGVSAGLRYSDDSLEYSTCSADFESNTLPIFSTAVFAGIAGVTGAFPNFSIAPDQCFTIAENRVDRASFERPPLEEDNLSGRFALEYQADPDTLLFASVSRGFKSGAAPVITANVEEQLEPVRQEEVLAFEAGAKLTLADGRMQWNSSGFYYDYQDQQLFSEILDPVFTALPRLVNVPESRVLGFESELDVDVTEALSLRGTVSYTDTEITEFEGFNRFGEPENFEGSSFILTPDWQLTGLAKYETDLSAQWGLRAVASASYFSETSSSLTEESGFGIPAYTLVNGTVTLLNTDRGFDIGVFANNLFQENYRTSVDVVSDTVFALPGRPRTYGVRLGWQY